MPAVAAQANALLGRKLIADYNRRFAIAPAARAASIKSGRPGRVPFEDPDAILAVETLGSRAGLSLWTREELRRYPLRNLD